MIWESFLNYLPTIFLSTFIEVCCCGIGLENFLAATNLCPEPAEWWFKS